MVHVHTEPGGRVSYVPYKKLSARLMAFLKTLPYVSVCEKASIDEAFLLLQVKTGGAALISLCKWQPWAGSLCAPRAMPPTRDQPVLSLVCSQGRAMRP